METDSAEESPKKVPVCSSWLSSFSLLARWGGMLTDEEEVVAKVGVGS